MTNVPDGPTGYFLVESGKFVLEVLANCLKFYIIHAILSSYLVLTYHKSSKCDLFCALKKNKFVFLPATDSC